MARQGHVKNKALTTQTQDSDNDKARTREGRQHAKWDRVIIQYVHSHDTLMFQGTTQQALATAPVSRAVKYHTPFHNSAAQHEHCPAAQQYEYEYRYGLTAALMREAKYCFGVARHVEVLGYVTSYYGVCAVPHVQQQLVRQNTVRYYTMLLPTYSGMLKLLYCVCCMCCNACSTGHGTATQGAVRNAMLIPY